MTWRYRDMGGDPEGLMNYSGTRFLYRLAILTWSQPIPWEPESRIPMIPGAWAGHGGLYAIIRDHHSQSRPKRIAYIGVAESFSDRLDAKHHMYPKLVERRGSTFISLGRVRFERCASTRKHLEEIEQIVTWATWEHVWNERGMETLPGFRSGQEFKPWVIVNDGYRFHRQMPKRIAYPAFAAST